MMKIWGHWLAILESTQSTPVKNILQDIFCLARKISPYLSRILQDSQDFVNLARLCKILAIKGPFYLQD